MRVPAGLGDAGKKLWRSIDDVFDFAEEPGKVQILTQACRVVDIVNELDEAADEAPLRVRWDSPVISPFIAEARVQRALLVQLLGRLGLPENDEDDEAGELRARRSRASRIAAKSRWDRGY
jgi:hypothetical protein